MELAVSGAAILFVLGSLLSLALVAVVGDIFSEEIRTRLYRLPAVILKLAVRRVPADVREDLADEWAAELCEILHRTEGLPVTRITTGVRFSLGILRTARKVGRELRPIRSKAVPIRAARGRIGAIFVAGLATGITASATGGVVADAIAGSRLAPIVRALEDQALSAHGQTQIDLSAAATFLPDSALLVNGVGAARDQLRAIIGGWKDGRYSRIEVVGRAAKFGSREAAKMISYMRAGVIANLLRTSGVTVASAVGLGYDRPLPPSPTAPENRVVTVIAYPVSC